MSSYVCVNITNMRVNNTPRDRAVIKGHKVVLNKLFGV